MKKITIFTLSVLFWGSITITMELPPKNSKDMDAVFVELPDLIQEPLDLPEIQFPTPDIESKESFSPARKRKQVTHADFVNDISESTLQSDNEIDEKESKDTEFSKKIKRSSLAKVYKCQAKRCKQKSKTLQHLQQHILAKHITEKFLTCPAPDCRHTTSWEIPLKRHIKAAHNGAVPVPKLTPEALKRRNEVIAPYMPRLEFACTVCPLSFESKDSIDKHMKNSHTNEKHTLSDSSSAKREKPEGEL